MSGSLVISCLVCSRSRTTPAQSMVTALLLPSPARFLLVGQMLTGGAEYGEVLHQ